MTIEQAVKILSDHQKWRLGDDTIEATNPKDLTEAINIILKEIASNEWIDISEQLPPECTIVDTKYKNKYYAYIFHTENGEFDNCNYNPQFWRLPR